MRTRFDTFVCRYHRLGFRRSFKYFPVNFTLILLAFQMENEYSLTKKTVFQFAIEIDRYLCAWHVLLKRLDNSRSFYMNKIQLDYALLILPSS